MLSLGKVAGPSNLSFDKRVQPLSIAWLSRLCLFFAKYSNLNLDLLLYRNVSIS